MRIISSALLLSFIAHVLYFLGMMGISLWEVFRYIPEAVDNFSTFRFLSTQFGFAGVVHISIWFLLATYLGLAALIALVLYLYNRYTEKTAGSN